MTTTRRWAHAFLAQHGADPSCWPAVVLTTFYGMTSQEIADMQGIPRNTVKTRIRLGLGRLRDQLEVNDD